MPCAVCPQSRNAAPKEKIPTIAERYAIIVLAVANAAGKERQPMKRGITIQERLKDLRTERHLRLEELAQQTGISKSALGSYENDDYKEINHGNLVTLAKFYGVSTDYILCLTENRNHPNTELTELHLSDDMLDLLKSGQINNRLLCEIATHDKFKKLMTDTEIYMDGHATARFRDMNETLEEQRLALIGEHQLMDGDLYSETLRAGQIEEEDFFCHITHKTWDAILHDIRKAHEHDIDSTSDFSLAKKMAKEIQNALRFPGDHLAKIWKVIFTQFGIDFDKLSAEEQKLLKKILAKSPVIKNNPLNMRRRK